MPSTIYDIRLRYLLEDKASKGLHGVEQGAERAGRACGGLSGVLGKLGVLAAGGFGIQKAGAALVGFNADVQDTKVQIAGMLALTKKTDLSDELGRADKLFANLQARAKTLPGTTQEYARFAGMITQPIMDAGLGMADLENLTVNSVVAAKALGIQAEVAARDIDQALRGQFHSVDVFTGKLLGSIGYKGEEGRAKYNAMSGGERAAELKRALTQKQLGQLAAAKGQTFSGILSTVQDTLQQTLGKVGLPLFQAITEELKRWNTWADANADKLEAWGKEFGAALVDGFGFVKDTISFLIDHKTELIQLAKLWAAVKIGQGIAGMGASLASGGGGMLGKLGASVGGLKGAAGSAGMIAGAAMFGWEVGRALDEATGIGETLMEPVARLAGVWNDAAAEQDAKFKEIAASMKALDDAIKLEAQLLMPKGGATGTMANVRIRALQDTEANEANRLRDAARKYDPSDYRDPDRPKDAPLWLAMAPLMADYHQRKADELGAKADNRVELTDQTMAGALDKLTAAQRAQVDMATTSQEVLIRMGRAIDGQRTAFGPLQEQRPLTVDEVLRIIREVNGLPGDGKSGVGGAMKAPGKVNVTIQRIEVHSDDPDRFAFTLVDSLRIAAKNPSGAVAAIREG